MSLPDEDDENEKKQFDLTFNKKRIQERKKPYNLIYDLYAEMLLWLTIENSLSHFVL